MSPLARACRDFVFGYILGAIVIVLLARLEAEFGLGAGGVARSIVPLIGGTVLAGARFGRREQRLPEPTFSWRFAGLATLLGLAMSAMLITLYFAILGMPSPEESDAMPAPGKFAVVLIVLHILIARYFFPFAARQQVRKREKAGR